MIVELFSEETENLDGHELKSFPIVPLIQQELVEFAQNKLLESIELQQFLSDKEIEFLQKYVSFLDQSNSNFNNHNDLEQEFAHLVLTPSEKSAALEGARNRLNGLRVQRDNFGRREQKALETFSSASQIRIQRTSGSASLSSVSWSLALRKFHCILEKLCGLTDSIESHFWFSEIATLIEKLSNNEKTIMLKSVVTSGSAELMVFLLQVQEKLVIRFFDRNGCSMKELKGSFELLSKMLEKVNSTTSTETHSKITTLLKKQSLRILERRELSSSHLELIIAFFERAPRCDIFETVFSMLDSKKSIMKGSLQSRFSRLREPLDPTPLLPVFSSLSSSSSASNISTSSSATVKSFTVIEHGPQNPEEDVRRQVEELTRRQHRQEQEHKMNIERIAEETRRKVIEELRIQDETRKKVEEEHRLKAEQERLQKEKQEQQRLKAEQKAREERRRQELKCVFMRNVELIRHETGERYNESLLDGKLIGLYFSAHWCPPSLTFTPVLREFYQHVEADFEVVFASWDKTQQEMDYYLANYHGDWVHLPFGSPLVKCLYDQLSVTSIPSLVVLKPNGQVLTAKGRDEVQACNDPKKLVNHWKSFL